MADSRAEVQCQPGDASGVEAEQALTWLLRHSTLFPNMTESGFVWVGELLGSTALRRLFASSEDIEEIMHQQAHHTKKRFAVERDAKKRLRVRALQGYSADVAGH